jgi:hypothetical protein
MGEDFDDLPRAWEVAIQGRPYVESALSSTSYLELRILVWLYCTYFVLLDFSEKMPGDRKGNFRALQVLL